ncbi:octopine/nopaline transport system substrate-binding protein [Rhizobium sp. BK226]|uniref:ABC transporter substrate-binding protein n=1 Tax=Rhizobium anhuiense TaxID=1184720 RepID=A0A432NWX8_9HYPH|nr:MULTISPECIES: transporter substrate-binding domain-containing protein [Rhizobium]MBB4112478.1 octopine/nopaline transport system substrate-binding protein [Rhizobium sp. BK226]MBB4213101.1 octopine/nopaline transport system substrate-binding protein [Rhizobium sp. BK212]MBB4252439.1 octopine/nopaline transport system substrate-binding protein [Rhizobium sp. BK008]RUM04169.1 ABC transporter substrate-binding protein [Rhizobium anhuiense]GGD73163.1 nopaline-binding periplasmic protein [Rhizob
MTFISRVLTALSATAVLALSGTAHAEDKTWKTVTIATEGAFKPYNFTKPDGTLDGYEIELTKYLCDHMKVECKIVVQNFDGMIPALNAGKFDAIISGMSATAKREEVIAFSDSYGSTGQAFATSRESDLVNLPEKGEVFSLGSNEAGAIAEIDKIKPMLQGKTIGVQTASTGAAFVDKYLKGVLEVREYKTTEEHDLDLKAGRVDLVMASMAYLITASQKPGNEDMTTAGPRFQGGFLGRGSSVGLRKDDTKLKAMFNDAIAAAKADGTIKTLSEKWFGFDVTPK